MLLQLDRFDRKTKDREKKCHKNQYLLLIEKSTSICELSVRCAKQMLTHIF